MRKGTQPHFCSTTWSFYSFSVVIALDLGAFFYAVCCCFCTHIYIYQKHKVIFYIDNQRFLSVQLSTCLFIAEFAIPLPLPPSAGIIAIILGSDQIFLFRYFDYRLWLSWPFLYSDIHIGRPSAL